MRHPAPPSSTFTAWAITAGSTPCCRTTSFPAASRCMPSTFAGPDAPKASVPFSTTGVTTARTSAPSSAWSPGAAARPFLLGHSLGGLIALDYALNDGAIAGVIAAAPALGDVGVPRLLMAAGRVLSRIWPRFSMRTGMDLSALSREPEARQAVVDDPLFHRVERRPLSRPRSWPPSNGCSAWRRRWRYRCCCCMGERIGWYRRRAPATSSVI